MGWGNVAKQAAGGATKKASTATKRPAKKSTTKKAANPWGSVAKRAAAGGNYGASGNPAPTWGDTGRAAAVGGAGFAVSPEVQAIMRESGSTDPSDPHNWAAVRRALDSQAAANTPAPMAPGGSSGGGGTAPNRTPAPVVQPPTEYTAPPAAQAPSPVSAQAPAAAVSGKTFTSAGRGSFGAFDRLRNQRSPRSGLSVTPEMLRAAAQARMGTGAR